MQFNTQTTATPSPVRSLQRTSVRSTTAIQRPQPIPATAAGATVSTNGKVASTGANKIATVANVAASVTHWLTAQPQSLPRNVVLTKANSATANRATAIPRLQQTQTGAVSSIDGMPLLQTASSSASTIDPGLTASISSGAASVTSSSASVQGPLTPQNYPGGQADESGPPTGLEGLAYGTSTASDALIKPGNGTPYIPCVLPTPAAATQMHGNNTGNIFNPQWKQLVQQEAQLNGGLGDSNNGYLAYSKNQGFVRLLNPNLTPEQNREMAAISLQSGWAVENTPARSGDPITKNSKVNDWVNNFASNYANQFTSFAQNPAGSPMQIKDGDRTLSVQYDAQTGTTMSMCVKKAGGLEGFVQSHSTEIEGGLAVLSVACPVLAPMVGVAAGTLAVGVGAMEVGTQAIATGGLSWESAAGLGLDAMGVPDIAGGAAMSASEVALSHAALNAGGDLIDNGKLTGADLAGVGISALGVAGIRNSDALSGFSDAEIRGIQGALTATADLADNGKVTLSDIAGGVAPLVFDDATTSSTVNRTLENGMKLLATGVQNGKVTAEQVLAALSPALIGTKSVTGDPVTDNALPGLLSKLTDDRTTQQSIYNAFNLLAKQQDLGQVSLNDILQVLKPFTDQMRKDQEKTAKAAA